MSAKRIVKASAISRGRGKTDWKAIDALSDRAIQRAIKGDPDAAPILDKQWFKHASERPPTRKRRRKA